MSCHRKVRRMKTRAAHVADVMMKDEHGEGRHYQSDDDGNSTDAGQELEGGHFDHIWRTYLPPGQSVQRPGSATGRPCLDVVDGFAGDDSIGSVSV